MLLALLAAVVIATVPAQEKEPERRPQRGDTLVARGCLGSGVVEAAELEDEAGRVRYAVPLTYRLSGDKKLLKTLKEQHAHHADLLTVVLRSDLPDERRSAGARIGNTRIGLGIPDPNPSNRQVLPVLEVKGFEHRDIRCR